MNFAEVKEIGLMGPWQILVGDVLLGQYDIRSAADGVCALLNAAREAAVEKAVKEAEAGAWKEAIKFIEIEAPIIAQRLKEALRARTKGKP